MDTTVTWARVPLAGGAELTAVTATVDAGTGAASFAGTLQLGDGTAALPPFTFTGAAVPGGSTTLTVSAAAGWVPLPDYLPEVVVPEITGSVVIAASGAVTVDVTHGTISDVTIASGLLTLTGWVFRAQMNLAADATTAALGVTVSGAVHARATASETANLFIADVSGYANLAWDAATTAANAELVLTLSHAGGYTPFPDASLPDFAVTPACAGTLRMDDSLALSFVATANLTLPINVIAPANAPPVTLALSSPTNQAAGPWFGLTVTKPLGNEPFFGVHMDGETCVQLDATQRCVTVRATADSTGKISLTGTYTGGNLKPLEPFLPSIVADRVVVVASQTQPLTLGMVADLTAETISFTMAGRVQVTIPDVDGDVPFFVDCAALGSMGASGLNGAFTCSFPDITLGASLPMPLVIQGSTLAFSTIDMPNIDVGSLMVPPRNLTLDLTAGVKFVYDGQLPPELEQMLCPGTIEAMSVALKLDGTMEFSGTCTGLALRLPTSGNLALPPSNVRVPSVNHLRFKTITVTAAIGTTISFSVSTDFDMATGSSTCAETTCYTSGTTTAISHCLCDATCGSCAGQPAGLLGSGGTATDADDCLTCADGAAVTGVYTDGSGTCGSTTPSTPDAECLTSTVTATVALGVVDSSISLSMDASFVGTWLAPFNLTGFALIDPAFGFGVDLMAIKPERVSWSTVLLYKKSGQWPASLMSRSRPAPSLASEANLVEVRTDFLLDLKETDPSTGLPKFGIKLVTSELDLPTVSAMVFDAATSMSNTAKALVPSLPTLPAAPVLTDNLPSEFNSITFAIDGSLSLVEDGSFTEAASSAVIPAGLDLKLNTTGAQIFGFSWDLYLAVQFLPASISGFASDPLGALTDATVGMYIDANVTLPIGFVHFVGSLSNTHFALAGVGSFAVGGYALDLAVAMSTTSLALSASLALPALGTVSFAGVLTTASMSLSAAFTATIGGVSFSGTVDKPDGALPGAAGADTSKLLIGGTAAMPSIGDVSMAGEVSAGGGMDVSGSFSATMVGVSVSGTARVAGEGSDYYMNLAAQATVGTFGQLDFAANVTTAGGFAMVGTVGSSTSGSLTDGILDALVAAVISPLPSTCLNACTRVNQPCSSWTGLPSGFPSTSNRNSNGQCEHGQVSVNTCGDSWACPTGSDCADCGPIPLVPGADTAAKSAIQGAGFSLDAIKVTFAGDFLAGSGMGSVTLDITVSGGAQQLTFDLCADMANPAALATCLGASSGGVSPTAALAAFNSAICGSSTFSSAMPGC